MTLRDDLNEATARQIDAEELMRDEGDVADGMMTGVAQQNCTISLIDFHESL